MKDLLSKSDKHLFYKGNVLYSKLRPYLNKVIVADEDGACTTEILAFDFGHIYNKYAQVYLMSPFFVDYANNDSYGIKMPRLGIVLTTVNNRCVLITLDFLLLNQAFFLLANLIKQNACRFVIRVLRYKFALYRPLQYAIF